MKIEEEIQSTNFKNESHKATINLLFTAGWLHRKILQRLKNYQLTHEQFNMLRILRGQHPHAICMMNIARRMIDRNSNVTRIAEKLIDKSLIFKQQSEFDKREWMVGISAEGLALLAQIDADNEQLPPYFGLSDTEAQLLNALLDKMRDCPENGSA